MDEVCPQLSLLLLLQRLGGNLIGNEVDDWVWPGKLPRCNTAMHARSRRISDITHALFTSIASSAGKSKKGMRMALAMPMDSNNEKKNKATAFMVD